MPYLTIQATVSPLSTYNEVSNVFDEALKLANKLNVNVEFKLNEITCLCTPNGSKERIIHMFDKAYKGEQESKVAVS